MQPIHIHQVLAHIDIHRSGTRDLQETDAREWGMRLSNGGLL